MAKYNKPSKANKSVGMIIVTLIFIIIGIVCIIIGFKNDIVSWMKTFGIVVCVMLSPIVVYLIYKLVMKKIDEL